MNKKEFGLTIRNARKDKGYTREELAEKVALISSKLGENISSMAEVRFLTLHMNFLS